LFKPGDGALVDDPGYYNLFGSLRLQWVEMLAGTAQSQRAGHHRP